MISLYNEAASYIINYKRSASMGDIHNNIIMCVQELALRTHVSIKNLERAGDKLSRKEY